MSPHLWTLLRLAIAAAGVAFIAWSLTWTDRLILPPGHALNPDDEPVAVRVTAAPRAGSDASHDAQADGPWVVELPDRLGGGAATVERAAAGTGVDAVRYEPGAVTTLAQSDGRWLALGLVLMAAVPAIQAARWRLLMRCRGLDVGYGGTLRLTMVGLFFNLSLPGMTGGDVVKAYYVARESSATGLAVMSVVFDRVTGMIGLVVLAALAGLVATLALDQPGMGRLTLGAWAALAGLLLAGRVYLSRRVRARLSGGQGTESKVESRDSGVEGSGAGASRTLASGFWTLDLLRRVDQAAAAYRAHMPVVYAAVAVSVLAHAVQMTATAAAGLALGLDTPVLMLVAVLPVVFFAGTLPISYQGLGVMEALALAFLLGTGASANQVVGMLLVARLYLVCYALIGGWVVLRGRTALAAAR